MKVKIGPYLTWWGPYQIADLLQKVGISEDTCEKIGDKMPDWVTDVCQWVYDKRSRTVEVHIDKYDTWSMDSTLSAIIVPMLKQLRDTTHGYPSDFVTDADLNGQQMIFENDGFEYNEDAGFDEWRKQLNKIIWAFEQVNDDKWEDITDRVKLKKHAERMQEGFDLFGKHFRDFWD